MSSSYHPAPVKMNTDLQYHHAELDQNLDQFGLINLINLDSSEPWVNAHFNNLQPHPFPFPLSSSGGLDYYHQSCNPNSTSNDNLALFSNLEYSFELDNPAHLPPTTSSPSGPSSSPSWSPLDQLLFPSLTQLPQSSPLFPFDLTPSCHESISDSKQEAHLNLIDFSASIDSRLEDWNLIFDSIQSNQESNSYNETSQFHHLPDDESHRQLAFPDLQGLGIPCTEQLEEFNRPNIQSEAVGSGLYSMGSDPSDFTSPLSTNSRNYPSSVMRKRPIDSPLLESDLVSLNPLGMHLMNSSSDQQQVDNEEYVNLQHAENRTKNKRAKTSANRSTSKPKTHVCLECGKSFPRLTSLTHHKLTHNGERPFRCSFEGCTKSFTTSSNSKRHWRTHF